MQRKKKTKKVVTESSAPFTKVEEPKATLEEDYINANLFSWDISMFLDEQVDRVTKTNKDKIEELEAKVSNLEETEEKYNKVIIAAKECYESALINPEIDRYTYQLKEVVASTFGLEVGDF